LSDFTLHAVVAAGFSPEMNTEGIERSPPMLKVSEIKVAIQNLPEKDWQKWDRQIEVDSESGKLDFLIKEALDDKDKGNLKASA
jgi:hypothetical protein